MEIGVASSYVKNGKLRYFLVVLDNGVAGAGKRLVWSDNAARRVCAPNVVLKLGIVGR